MASLRRIGGAVAATIGLAGAKTDFPKVTAEVNATGRPVTALKNNRPWVVTAATPGWASSSRRLGFFWSRFCRRCALFSGFRRASRKIDSLFRHFGRIPQVAAKSAPRLPAGLLLATRRLLGGCRQNVGKANRFDFGAASPGLGAWPGALSLGGESRALHGRKISEV